MLHSSQAWTNPVPKKGGEAQLPEEACEQLWAACSTGDLPALERVLAAHPTRTRELVNAPDKNGTAALGHCAWFGHLEIALRLIKEGADLNHRNLRKNSALHFCYERGWVVLIATLLQHGAGRSLLYRNTFGKTPRALIPEAAVPSKLRSQRDRGFMSSRLVLELQQTVARCIPKAPNKCPRPYHTGAKLHPGPQVMHELSSACALTPGRAQSKQGRRLKPEHAAPCLH